MKRIVLSVCLLVCLAAGAVAGWKLYGYYHIYQDGIIAVGCIDE